jgi:hypothetical protein
MQDKVEELKAEWAGERAALEQKLAVQEAERDQATRTLRASLTRAVEEAISGRFPTAPLTLATRLHEIQDPQRLDELLRVALRAPDLETIERAVAE